MPFNLQFTPFTFLWLIACLALGAGYAFLLYRSSAQLPASLRKALFGLRAIAVAAIAFLLFAPLIKMTNKLVEKPLILLVQDNSASIAIAQPPGFKPAAYAREMQQLEKTLADNYEVRSFQFGSAVKPGLAFSYNEKLSNFSSVFKTINDQFANRNIGAVIIASDGIYNNGGNPLYDAANVKAPVYTVALGDTVAKRDILIANVNYNNIVYLDNQFQIEVAVEAFQSNGASSRITVADKNGTLFTKPLQVTGNEFRSTVPITLSATRKGIQRYTVRIDPIANELSERNNTFTFFVEVLDGKQKVLIVANSPHPDIAAIKQAIGSNKNYDVKTVYVYDVKPTDVSDAGLVIFHQLPSVNNPVRDLLKQAATKPAWFIIGSQSSVPAFTQSQNALGITSTGNMQETLALVNPSFYGFTLSETTKTKLQNFAPLLSPFGNYGLKGPATVLLNQQIGKVATDNPLLLFSGDAQRKTAVLTGEGIWRWRMEDFQENGNHEAVDELLGKTIQYLSARDDKRKFRAYPARSTFDENESVLLNAELYNDSYELVNTPDVRVSLSNSDGKSYSFLFSRSGNSYALDAGVLPPGEYSFSANTELGKIKHSSSGSFAITQQQAEYQHTRANHQLLYSLSQESGGQLVYPGSVAKLAAMIKANEQVKTISYEDRKYEDLINLKTIFFLILGLLSVEWFMRKRSGEL